MFLSSDSRPALFSELQLAFALPNGRNVTLSARVVHVLAGQKARELSVAPGFGVQFGTLDALQRSALDELVAWARARDPRPRIARVVAGAARAALQQDPMLSFLLDHIDGQRDPEALAEELALDVEMVERMLTELKTRAVIELISARELASQAGSVRPSTILPPPVAAASSVAPASSPMPVALARELAELEARLPTADHYQLLGVERGASAQELRAAFQARDNSLDPSSRPPAEAQRLEGVLSRLREAYGTLSSPERRAEYDEYLQRRHWLSAAEARISIRPPPPDASDQELAPEVHIPRHDRALAARDPESAAAATRPPPSASRPSRPRDAIAAAAIGAASRGSVSPSAASPTRPPPGASPSTASAAGSGAPSAASGSPASRTRPPPAGSVGPRASAVPRRSARTRPPSQDLSDMAKAYAVSAEASRPVRASQPPAARGAQSERPPPTRPSQAEVPSSRSGTPTLPPPSRASKQPLAAARLSRPPTEAKLGAAAQILMQAEAAYAAGQMAQVTRHLKLLAAMTFDDPQVQARFAELKSKAYRSAATDFEKQAAYEEKQQQWARAAQSWLRVAEGRPSESMPLQRAALAQLQAGVELRLAMDTAKRALELAPNDAQAHRIMAKVYVAADMQANARRELEAAERCSRAEGGDDLSPTALLKRLLGRDDKA